MPPFPFFLLSWRESIVGVQPIEMVHMQVEKNWVQFNPVGTDLIGNGSAQGRNMGFVKWRMKDETVEGRKLRMLHSESYELSSGDYRIEEDYVDPVTNVLVLQREQRTTKRGNERSECAFFPDRIELRRTLIDGRTVTAEMVPAEGMEAVQQRFVPLGAQPKDFVVVDGIRGTFYKVRVEQVGRFRGNWGVDKYEGNAYRFTCGQRSETVMLDDASEIVKVEFTDKISLALTSQPKSKRYEENLPGRKSDLPVKNDAPGKPTPVPTPVPVPKQSGNTERKEGRNSS